MSDGGQHGQPVLRVTRGRASREELAAVTAVIAAVLAARQRHAQAAHAAAAHRPATRPGWPDRAALLHAAPRPGPGAWHRAFRPR
jgi:hypothetical protein